MKVLQEVLLVLSVAVLVKGNSVHWDYENQKHQFWTKNYPHCALESQSPIDVDTKVTSYNDKLSRFSLALFTSTREDIEIVNNGHNIQVNLKDAWTIPRGMGGLSDNFKAAQFHFHWAKKGSQGGSEHTVNGKQAWGEMHVVHYNAKYGNITEAASKSDGLAVLGFLIEDNARKDHRGFARLDDWIRNGQYNGDKSHLSYFKLKDIIRNANLRDYYRYKGSLTTPPCYESVSWTLFKDPIRISKNQASFFQDNLYAGQRGKSTKHESGNFRPTQPLNGRKVYHSWAPQSDDLKAMINEIANWVIEEFDFGI